MKSFQTVCLLFATAGLVAAQQYTITTVAGIPDVAGLYPVPGDATLVPATNGQLRHPTVVNVDPKGNVYIADDETYSVRVVNATTGNISTIAGNGTPGTTGDLAAATSAEISDVHGMAFDSSGNVYISDTSSCRIRRIDNPFTNTTPNIQTIAGNQQSPFCGASSGAPFASPGALAVDSKGNLYVADYLGSVIDVVSSSGVVTKFAGTGTYGNSGDGGPASKANLAYPVSLVFDAAGNLYVGDEGNSNIRKIDTSGNISTVVNGVNPLGLGIDSAGNFYYVDGISSSVNKILPGGGVVMIAGNGQAGYGGDGSLSNNVYSGGQASLATLNKPAGLALGPDGSIYFADTLNDVIRHLVIVPNSVGVQDAASEAPGTALQPGSISPGEILTLFGSGLGPGTLTTFTLGSNGQFPTQIAGTSVTFNSIPAPLIYASSGLVAAIAPYEISGSTSANIVVNFLGKIWSATMPVAAVAPAIFTANASGTGQAAALNQNLSVNSASNPAKTGSTIALYVTGVGNTTAPVDGQVAPTNCGTSCLATPLGAVTVKIGNQFLGYGNGITYIGAAPSLVAGVAQINVTIPTTLIPGTELVQVMVNGLPSQSGVTVAVTQ
jgi:uncharacterized protein (TIGR03437 family)